MLPEMYKFFLIKRNKRLSYLRGLYTKLQGLQLSCSSVYMIIIGTNINFRVRLHSFLAFSIKMQMLFLLRPTAKLIMHLRCLFLLLPTAKLIMHLRWFKPDLILGGYGVETTIKVVSGMTFQLYQASCRFLLIDTKK
ncbi:hypothetical protein AAC387_Pa10g2150 [Persea americana]